MMYLPPNDTNFSTIFTLIKFPIYLEINLSLPIISRLYQDHSSNYPSAMKDNRQIWCNIIIMKSLNGSIFHFTGPFFVKFTGHKWIHLLWMHSLVMNSPHKGQWRGALMFSLICTWTNGWVNNRDAGDLRCHRTHYNVTVMIQHG